MCMCCCSEETANPKMVAAGKKSWQTRRINILLDQYEAAKTAGVKAGIKRKINALLAE